MKLLALSRWSIVLCALGLTALLLESGSHLSRIFGRQQEVADLLSLRDQINDFSAASDALVLMGADRQLLQAFIAQARSTQARLRALPYDNPAIEPAIHRIEKIIGVILRESEVHASAGSADAGASARPAGADALPALAVSIHQRTLMNQVAAHGIALDTTLNRVLGDSQRAIARSTWWLLGTLGASTLLFGTLCTLTFGLLHRRVARPVRAITDTIERLHAGERDARTRVDTADELGELAQALNRTLDAQQAADAHLRDYRELIESSSDLFAIIDGDYRYVLVNSEYARMHGREVPQIEGQRVPDILGEAFFEGNWRAVIDSALAGEDRTVETEYDYPTGGTHHVLERIHPVETRPGRTRRVGVVITDITEQREMERQLERSHDELQGMLANRHAMINSLAAHIALVDQDGRIVDVNDQWRHFGKENELQDPNGGIGVNYLEICDGASGDCAEEAEQVAAGLREVIAGTRDQFALEYPCHAPDTPRWFRAMITRLAPNQHSTEDLAAVVMHVDITERKLAEQKLSRMAFEDPLTGLRSRNGFVQSLQQRLEPAAAAHGGMVVMLDIKGLRNVNDAHGYAVGDRLLIELGERLQAGSRPAGIACRLGGDEFALYLPPRKDRDPDARAADICSDIERVYHLGAVRTEIHVRIGYTSVRREQAGVEGLLREAELALFESHRLVVGQGQHWASFSEDLDQLVHDRLRMAEELRRALDEGQLELHYQPKVELETGALVGCEALMRWNHPERGLVPPNEFIPVAEQSQLIGPMGDWAIRHACQQLRAWNDAGLEVVRVAVNVSVVQFWLGDFPATVRAAIEDSGIEPWSLSIEITESVFERESQELLGQIRAIKDFGVHVALDDFGTGYSSLLYLQKYPFDEIKVDQGFVRRLLEDRYSHSIVETVLNLASALGAEPVAEGVETTDERDALVQMDCRLGQGYYYSMPLAEEDFRWLLERRSRLPLGAADQDAAGAACKDQNH